jgi:hypothetical protein
MQQTRKPTGLIPLVVLLVVLSGALDEVVASPSIALTQVSPALLAINNLTATTLVITGRFPNTTEAFMLQFDGAPLNVSSSSNSLLVNASLDASAQFLTATAPVAALEGVVTVRARLASSSVLSLSLLTLTYYDPSNLQQVKATSASTIQALGFTELTVILLNPLTLASSLHVQLCATSSTAGIECTTLTSAIDSYSGTVLQLTTPAFVANHSFTPSLPPVTLALSLNGRDWHTTNASLQLAAPDALRVGVVYSETPVVRMGQRT